MQFERIKLVVMDLDETFWEGTLSEGSVHIPESRRNLVQSLVDRGIMCSISSKNDFAAVKRVLENVGLWDLFVFPRINWEPKGPQVKTLVESCCLRSVNVLFVDDNVRNREEVSFHCPGIQLAGPEILSSLLTDPRLVGKPDEGRVRLQQFKILEAKDAARAHCASNQEFLYKSNVRVALRADCNAKIDRILELVNRTNQLNYTKKRLTESELRTVLHDGGAVNRYVTVKDAFGDYGIVGFVSVKDNMCTHFLFSCRVIGLGVEQWVWTELKFPEVTTIGEVAVRLERGHGVEWINQGSNPEMIPAEDRHTLPFSVLLRGGCDLRQMEPYLRFRKLDCEFNHLRYHRDHTAFAVDVLQNGAEDLQPLRERVPFLWDNSFDTDIYSGQHDVVVFSLLIDYIQTVYRSKNNPRLRLAFGGWMQPLSEKHLAGFAASKVSWFLENFEATGCIAPEELKADLENIYTHLAPWTHLVLINACEVEHENPLEAGALAVHVALNHAVDDFVACHSDRVSLLDMRRIVVDRSQLTDNIRHYRREVYYEMANELTRIIGGFRESRGNLGTRLRWNVRRVCMKIKNRAVRLAKMLAKK